MIGLLFTYLMTYGGAGVALFNPYIGLLVYVCFAIIKPESMWYWAVPRGNYSRIVALGLLVGWAIRGFGQWRFHRAKPIVICLIGYWLWMVLCAAFADDQDKAWAFVESQAKIILPFVVGITILNSVAKLKTLAWVIVLSQGYVAYEFNLSYYGGVNRVQELFAGMDNNCMAIGMVSCVGLAFFLGLHAPSWWQKALAFGSAALMAHVVMFSLSRGGMLALIITGVVSFWLIPRKQPVHYAAFVLAMLFGLRMAGEGVRNRFFSTFADSATRDSSAQHRLDLWTQALDTMVSRPLLGLGPDNWLSEAAKHTTGNVLEVHSLWLQIGAELGIPGLCFLVLFYGSCLVMLWPYTREKLSVPDPWIRYLARMVIASLIGFAVSSQFVSLKMLEIPFYVTLIGAGTLKLATLPNTSPAVSRRPATISRPRVLVPS